MYTYSYIYIHYIYIYYCIKCIYIYDICVIEQNNFFFQINNRYTYWSSCRNKLPRHFCCSAPEVLLNPEAPSWDKSCEAAVGDFFSIVWIGLLLFIGILIYGCLLISGGSSYIESPLQHFWNLRMDPQRGVLQQWFFFLMGSHHSRPAILWCLPEELTVRMPNDQLEVLELRQFAFLKLFSGPKLSALQWTPQRMWTGCSSRKLACYEEMIIMIPGIENT